MRRRCFARVSLLFTILLLGILPPPAAAETPSSPVRLVFASELIPLSFEEAGEVKGILVDVAREVFGKRLGRRVDTAAYPWLRAQHMVQSGEADGFITIATKARAAYADCGRIPVLRVPLHPLMRKDNPRRKEIEAATKLSDMRRFSIVSYLGNGWAKENLADFDVYYAADFQASLRGLAQGRGDLAFVTTTSGAYYLREFDLEDRLVMLPQAIDTFEYVLCLSKKSPHVALLPEFERVLEVLRSDGGYGPILARYGMQTNALY